MVMITGEKPLKSVFCIIILLAYVGIILGVIRYFQWHIPPEVKAQQQNQRLGFFTRKRSLHGDQNLAIPAFSDIASIPLRKKTFLSYIGVIADKENEKVLKDRRRMKEIARDLAAGHEPSKKQKRFLLRKQKQYRVAMDDDWSSVARELLKRINIIPIALVQVQAATESGWGTSRFAREANNYFGQWCFKEGCGVVPSARPPNSHHEVARFDDPAESLRAYMMNLNSFHLYEGFRAQRAALAEANKAITATELVNSLDRYSERGQAYIDQISGMIRGNDLE